MNKGQPDNTNVTFKLHLDKKTGELRKELKFEDLERRLSNLEKILGTTNVNYIH